MLTATAREENGEFCIAVAPATRTAGIYWPSWLKALAVKLSRPSGWSGSHTGLIAFNPRRLKGLKVDELPRNGPSYLCEIFFTRPSPRMYRLLCSLNLQRRTVLDPVSVVFVFNVFKQSHSNLDHIADWIQLPQFSQLCVMNDFCAFMF